MSKIFFINILATTAVIFAISGGSTSSAFAAGKFSRAITSGHSVTTKAAVTNSARKVSKKKLKAACRKTGGQFMVTKKGVYSCMSKNAGVGDWYVAECTKNQKCNTYHFKD